GGYNNKDDESVHELLTNPDYSIVNENAPLRDANSEVIGYGWNVMSGIWDGTRSIGWLAADNFLHQQPLLPYQVELLKLYGLTLGHLITRKRIEDTLRESEERFRAIAEASPLAISISERTADGRLLYANRGFSELFGYPLEMLPTLNLNDLYY